MAAPLMRGKTLAARDLMLDGRLLFFWSALSRDCVFLRLLARRLMFES